MSLLPVSLILPGLGNSGPEHWQSHWERQDPSCRRVSQAEWDTPRCDDWVATLDDAVAGQPGSVILVAHSSSCALVAHWTQRAEPSLAANVRGALLVAPSDPDGPSYPPGPTGFSPVPLERLPFPSVVVARANDVYVSLDRAREYADAWGSRFVDVGMAGHVNAASGIGSWPAGYVLLEELRG